MDVIVRPKAPKTSVVPQPVPQIANPPITREVVLMCSGSCRAPTTHKFIITRRAGMNGHEQIYACTCCHTERRYGLL